LDYRVEYSNEGQAIAFGVYFTDTLGEDLDDSRLEIGPVVDVKTGSQVAGPGSYDPRTRTVTWLVGEVGPGEGGHADLSVKVKSDATPGTEIINFGTVYFPSVPETTRTNGVVSTVALTLTCTGDCDGSSDVAISEIITMVNIALGNAPLSACTAGDADGSGTIEINEIILAVNNALNGCQ
jgi:hypothetical protein